MGAAASTEVEKEELRAAFAAYGGYGDNPGRSGGSSSSAENSSSSSAAAAAASISASAFEALLSTHAPTVHGRLLDQVSSAGGGGGGGGGGGISGSALALRDQFDSAKRKLGNAADNQQGARSAGACAAAGASAAPGGGADKEAGGELAARHPEWAWSKEVNLQQGLVKGMLRSRALRTVRFVVGQAKPTSPPTSPLPPSSSSSPSSVLAPTKSPSSSLQQQEGVCGGGVKAGSQARVVGLVTKPEINGLLVDVAAFEASKGRYRVCFPPHSGVANGLLKPENLAPVACTVPPPSSTSAAASETVLVALVDTGAERSAMSPAAAARVGLAPRLLDSSFARTVGGVGSAVGFGRVHFASIRFPDAVVVTAAATAAAAAVATTLGDRDGGDAGKKETVPVEGDASLASTSIRKSTSEGGASSATSAGGLLFDASFDVFEWPREAAGEFDAILGLDLLLRYHGSLDFKRGDVRLNVCEAAAAALPHKAGPSGEVSVSVPMAWPLEREATPPQMPAQNQNSAAAL